MYGIKSFVLFTVIAVAVGCILVVLLKAWVVAWEDRKKRKGISSLLSVTAFILMWFCFLYLLYFDRVQLHYELWKLNASEVYSVQAGQHDFRDHTSIQDFVVALHHNRWFDVDHGGFGTSISLIIRQRSGTDMVIGAAQYCRESGAVIYLVQDSSTRSGFAFSPARQYAFVPELPRVLAKYGASLPNCDVSRRKPSGPSELDP